MTERCPTCGRPLVEKRTEPTDRELDVLAAWWGTDNLRMAAQQCGISYQRAKNLLARCRIRSGAKTNAELLVQHMDKLRSHLPVAGSQNIDRSEAA